MKEKKVQLSLWAKPQELCSIKRIMEAHGRSTASDAIRFLIAQEDEKILSKNIATAIK